MEVDSIPATATELVAGGVFAQGTATGNAHRALGPGVEVMRCSESGLVFILAQSGAATITHAEHGERDLPFRYSVVKPKREYDHFLEESREVLD
jgi:hypothetical protein